jgi:gliding motility-associated lipoprotein GldD
MISWSKTVPDKKKCSVCFIKLDGNAATNSQFYVTDSTRHFVTGSVYFTCKPNFDSIMPAASYIKRYAAPHGNFKMEITVTPTVDNIK